MSAADGSGSTVTYNGSELGEVTGISWSGMERAIIESTHLATSEAKTYIAASLYDAGEVTIELNIDDNTHLTHILTHTKNGHNLVIDLNEGDVNDTFTVKAICNGTDPLSANEGNNMTATLTFKLTGEIL